MKVYNTYQLLLLLHVAWYLVRHITTAQTHEKLTNTIAQGKSISKSEGSRSDLPVQSASGLESPPHLSDTHLLESNVPPSLILNEPRCTGPEWPPWVLGVKEELGNRQVIRDRCIKRFTRYFSHYTAVECGEVH